MKKNRPFEAEESLLEDLQWLRHLAARLIQDPALADDACQEAWLLAASSGEVRDRRPALFRAMRRFAWRWNRSEGRRKTREAAGARSVALPSTAELIARGEERQVLWRRLTELDEPYRTALLLKFQEGLDTKAIAVRKGAPEDTVRRWIRRGLELLRERYTTDRDGSGLQALSLAALPLGISSTSAAMTTAVPSAKAWSTTGSAGTSLAATASSLGAVLGAWIMKKALIAVAVLLVGLVVGRTLWRQVPEAVPALTAAKAREIVQVERNIEASSTALAAATVEGVRAAVTEPSPSKLAVPETFENCRVTGRVTDAAGDPVAGATVRLLGGRTHWSLPPEWTTETVSGSDGSFALETQGLQTTKPIRLRVEGSPFLTEAERLFGPDKDCDFGELRVPAVHVGRIVLKPAGIVIGRLLDPQLQPIEGAWIDPSRYSGYARSDADGRFRFEHLAVRSTELRIKCAGYIRQETVAAIREGETIDLGDLIFEVAPRVSGVVTDLEGRPVPESSVSTGGYTRGWVFETDADGQFDVPLPYDEPGTIYARGKKHEQTDGLRVTPGETGIHIQLQPYDPYYTFYAMDSESGEPLAQFGITLREGAAIEECRTDTGEWKWDAPKSSQRWNGRAGVLCRDNHSIVEIAAPGYERLACLITPDASTDSGQMVHLEKLASVPGIRGRLIGKEGPLAGASVELIFGDLGRVQDLEKGDAQVPLEADSPAAKLIKEQGMYTIHSMVAIDRPLPSFVHHSFGGLRRKKAYTNAQGQFLFTGTERGVGRLSAKEKNGTALPVELFFIDEGSDIDLGDVELVTSATVKGRLLPEWAGDLSGCTVTLESDSSRKVRVEADGLFEFADVPPGDHILSVEPGPKLCSPDLWKHDQFFRVGAGEVRELDVAIPAFPGCQLAVRLLVNGKPAQEASIDLIDVLKDDSIADLEIDADSADSSSGPGETRGLVRAGVELRARIYYDDTRFELPETFVLPAGSAERTLELATGALEVDVPIGLELLEDTRVQLSWQTAKGATGPPLTLSLYQSDRLVGSRAAEDLRFVFPSVPLEAVSFSLYLNPGGPYSEDDGELLGSFEAELDQGGTIRVSM